MNINPIHNPANVQKAYGKTAPARPAASTATSGPAKTDRLELSGADHTNLLGQLKANDVRWAKVNEIKSQIASGTYETDDKLDAASHKLLGDVIG